MNFIKLLGYLLQHPLAKKNTLLAFKKLMSWQIAQKFVRRPYLMPFINDSVLLVKKGMTGATGNIYTGLHEFEEMAFLLHFLREEDVFFDVGANVGSYTILASKVIGANTCSFEPSPDTFTHLKNNVFHNRITDKVTCLNKGIGGEKGKLYFTTGKDTINHVLLEKYENSIEVEIISLDDFNSSQKNSPQLIKIDVEGFETEVIKGAIDLINRPEVYAIIMELNGSGNRYGFNEDELHNRLLQLGYNPFHYLPFKRKLVKREDRSKHGNTIYVKNESFVQNRLETAPKFKALERYF